MFRCIAQPVRPFVKKRTVDLVGVTQQDDLCILPCPGDDPFDLIRRCILSLINDQIGFHDGASPYVVERFGLDDAPAENLVDLPFQLFLVLIPLLFT